MTDMTQAPTPGPLSGDDVKLLVKGDLISHPEHGVAQYWPVLVDDMYLTGPWSFIGRPGADGWMPWSGGEPTITDPAVDIEVRLRNGELHVDRSPAFDWTYDPEPHPFDIIAFRLAPTAPVEASGSEREHGPKCWGGTSFSDEMAHCYCGSTDLRPQPSGETREAVRLALEDADALDRVSEEADDNQWQDWAATMRQAASRIRRLALLSTSPLALGGQKGNSETLRVLLDNLVIAQTLSKDIRQKATDEARSYLYDLRHTPQPSGETREQVAELIEAAIVRHDPTIPLDSTLDDADAILALLSARPLALGGQHSGGEDAAWTWLNGHVECDPADRDYSADEMVDAFMAGAGRYDRWSKALERIAGEHQHRSGYCQTDITVEPALTAEEAQTVARDALSGTPVQSTAPVAETAGEAEQTALNIICDPGIITGLHTAAEARDWIEKSVRAALLSKKKPTSEEVDARRRLINLIEQWDGESEYDAEDIASLADDILHAFNGAPVLSWPALGYVSADAETALKAGINRVIYPAPSAHASFPLYSAPVPAQDDDKLRIPAKWFEVAEYATERGLAVHESNMRMEEFRRVVTPAAVLSVSADEEIK